MFDSLAQFAPVPTEVKIRASTWSGHGFAFDQSLTNTGYVEFSYGGIESDGLSIIDMKTLHTAADTSGWSSTLARAAEIFEKVCTVIEKGADIVLCESPPVGNGPGLHRVESSIVTATAVWCAAQVYALPVDIVSANRVKKYLTGKPNAAKIEVRRVLEARLPEQLAQAHLHKNEHVFDALGIAVTWTDNYYE